MKILSGNLKLQNSVEPSRLCRLGLLTFYTFPQNSSDWQGIFTPFLASGLYNDHEFGFLLLKLYLQDRISLSPLCRCQFTMCFIIQTHYYKPSRYKNSRNSFITFLLTRDSHSVIHCCHSSCCSSHSVTAAAVLNKGTTQAQRCCGSFHCSHLSLMAYLQSSMCSAWKVSYPISTIICRTQLWCYVSSLSSDSSFISPSS